MKKSVTAHRIVALALGAGLLFLSVAAQADAPNADMDNMPVAKINDPLEPLNRGTFALNNAVDKVLIEPVAIVYNALLPSFVRDGVRNFMRNLESPLIVANNVLQGDFKGAGVATARFVVNTTMGVGGLVDAAGGQGMPYEKEDFGQTLAKWGVGHGPYIVLPIIGPSSLRDTVGLAATSVADPVRLVAHNTEHKDLYYTRVGVDGLDTRARLVEAVRDMRKNSLDYYAAVRSAYAQKRQSLVNDEASGAVSIPTYDDNN